MKHPFTTAIALVLVLLAAAPALAQTTGSVRQTFEWTIDAPTLDDAQGYAYHYYADSETGSSSFVAVVCTGVASPFTCRTPIPAFQPGNHTIAITAENAAGESGKSGPFAFVFVATPAVPSPVRIR